MSSVSAAAGIGRPDRSRRLPEEDIASFRNLLLMMAAHVPLAFAMKLWPAVATVHALAVIALGIGLLFRGRPQSVVVLCGYVVGVELLWRGAKAGVFWEIGKYTLIVLLALTLFRYRAFRGRSWRGVVFIALLLPSLLVLSHFDRERVAFNLSGPVALGVSLLFFGSVRIDRQTFSRTLLACLIPIVGLAALALSSTTEAVPAELYSGTKATSAGIGPNQMSSVLGLGMYFAFLLHFVAPRKLASTRIFLFLSAALGVQCLLTFSRGGLWGGLGAMLATTLFLLRTAQSRRALLSGAILVAPLLHFFVLPTVDEFTGGLAMQRFRETGMTGRDKIMEADLIVFRENTLLGVGPGESGPLHALTFRASGAHTEYTRLLAEHGSFGLVAILLLLFLSAEALIRPGSDLDRASRVGLIVWALLYMGHSATRLAAPAFAFGWAAATFLLGSRALPVRRLSRTVRPAENPPRQLRHLGARPHPTD